MEYTPFEQEAIGKRCLLSPVDCFFRRVDRRAGKICNRFGGYHGFLHKIGTRNQSRYQPTSLCLFRIHHTARKDQIHGFGLAHSPGQPLRTPYSRNDRELDLRLANFAVSEAKIMSHIIASSQPPPRA